MLVFAVWHRYRHLFYSLLLIIYSLTFSTKLHAQLSPGDLHKSHANLEGIENCTKCHESGQQLNPQKCLQCHTILKQRIDNNKGLHANSDYRQCENCHVEHQGRDYDLIYWQDGRDAFDHSKTGYTLKGKHSKLKCEDCHKAANIREIELFKKNEKDPQRTFLGLQQACLSCHHDEHRGQLEKDCLTCHNMDSWKPAPKFNHNKTGYPLTGRHKNVKCAQCHKTVTDNKFSDDDSFIRFAQVKHNLCTDCHQDVHNNKFGPTCTQCHNTSGWQNYNEKSFNHNKTRYPLKGKHAALQCESCHKPGQPLRIARFQNCMDCHSDFHQGQFARRSQKGACEECHTVNGFSPSLFSITDHQKTDFQLQGSHLAVPCFACHKTITSRASRVKTIQFQFTAHQCINCHQDVHKGQTTRFVSKQKSSEDQCAYCHNVESWRNVSFDHSKTGFILEGRHLTTACSSCHWQENSADWTFKSVAKECSSCHQDVHGGQFRTADNRVDCARCHTSVDWLAEKFDHEKDAGFSLKGGHRFVPCSGCHKAEDRNGIKVVRYKPLNTKCESCHK